MIFPQNNPPASGMQSGDTKNPRRHFQRHVHTSLTMTLPPSRDTLEHRVAVTATLARVGGENKYQNGLDKGYKVIVLSSLVSNKSAKCQRNQNCGALAFLALNTATTTTVITVMCVLCECGHISATAQVWRSDYSFKWSCASHSSFLQLLRCLASSPLSCFHCLGSCLLRMLQFCYILFLIFINRQNCMHLLNTTLLLCIDCGMTKRS